MTAGNGPGANSSGAINDNSWHHIAITRDASTGVTQVYVDGQVRDEVTGPAGLKTMSFSDLGRIFHSDGDHKYFQGSLDDVCIYDGVLGAETIRSIYNLPVAYNQSVTTAEETPKNVKPTAFGSGEYIVVNPSSHGTETAFAVDLRLSIVGDLPGPLIESFSLDEPGALFEDPQYHTPYPLPDTPSPPAVEATGGAADFRPLSSPRAVPAADTVLAVVNIDTSEVAAGGGAWSWLLSNSVGGTAYAGTSTVPQHGTIIVGQRNVWNGPDGGSWNEPGNWTNNSVPNGLDAVANLLELTNGPSTVTLGSDATVGTLNFERSGEYTIAGAGKMTFDASSSVARVNVLEGSHTISVPVSLHVATEVVVGPGNRLSLAGGITGSGNLIKEGPGTLALEAVNGYLGETRIDGGTVEVASNASLGHMSSGLWIDGGTLRTSGSFSGTRDIRIGAGGATLDITGTTTLTLASASPAVIDGEMTKEGTGTLVVSSGLLLAGAIHVNHGVLQPDKGLLATAGGDVQIATGATLKASGAVNRRVPGGRGNTRGRLVPFPGFPRFERPVFRRASRTGCCFASRDWTFTRSSSSPAFASRTPRPARCARKCGALTP